MLRYIVSFSVVASCKGIRISESGKFLPAKSRTRENLPNPKSWALESGIQLKALLWNPESKFHHMQPRLCESLLLDNEFIRE